MYKVLCPERIEKAGEDYLHALGCEIITLDNTEHEAIKTAIADADAAVIRFNAVIDAEILAAAPKLKIVARHGVGFNNIDTKAAANLGIWVGNARGANSNTVAEQAMMLIMALAKKLPQYKNALENNAWNTRNDVKTDELCGKTLGVYGCGANGRRLCEIAHCGFGMKILAFDPYADPASLPDYIGLVGSIDELLASADVVSMHCVLNEKTHHCISGKEFAKMKKSAWLINCARGGLVDEEALYMALTDGTIAAAGLDVFESEPPKKDCPLYKLDNFFGTLHQASNSKEASDRCALYAVYCIEDVMNGNMPRYAVNKPDETKLAARLMH